MLAACEGEAGPTGPAGPTGAEGAQGPIGPQGPIGNANVISGQFTAAEADWSTTTVQFGFGTTTGGTSLGKPARYLDIAVPDITADVVTDGAVLVFMQHQNSPATSFVPLPFEFYQLTSSLSWNYLHLISAGNIRVLFFYRDLTDPSNFSDSPLSPAQMTRVYRWVIIPPAAAPVVAELDLALGADAIVSELRHRGFEVSFGGG